jgi:uncharacterized SAM-binding protein YcdF (DUF218 family)
MASRAHRATGLRSCRRGVHQERMETLFFVAAKLFWALAQPASWLVLALVAALVALFRGARRAALWWLSGAICAVVIVGILPLGQPLLRPLETRFPVGPRIEAPAGIIVLGGGEDAVRSAATGRVELNEGAERLIAGLALARRHPEARLIFTGGSGRLGARDVSGATVAARLFAEFDVAPARVLLEGRSRNTAENARRTAALVADPAAGPWVLVTSAFHMPRSLGAFCAAGWEDLVPYPVDHRAAGPFAPEWDLAGHLAQLDTGLREWIGLLAYRATGRTDALLPDGC